VPKVCQHAVCKNFVVKIDRRLCSRNTSTAQDENATSLTSNIAAQESVSDTELERNV
jgi:hypothetical protein